MSSGEKRYEDDCSLKMNGNLKLGWDEKSGTDVCCCGNPPDEWREGDDEDGDEVSKEGGGEGEGVRTYGAGER